MAKKDKVVDIEPVEIGALNEEAQVEIALPKEEAVVVVPTLPKTKAEIWEELEAEVAKLGNIGHFYYVELGRARISELLQQLKTMI